MTTPIGSTGDAGDPLAELRQDAADLVCSIRSLLGIDSAMAELDPAGFGQALGRLAMSVAGQPAALSRSA
ncbi:MAG: poly-beta-hydroxybutyrate polymerase, partial [Pseudonocardiales bacterium]|nr:poly-beta-hydroxybutyrate polymerase [Pseudonocardiales bacterium]